MKYSFILLAVAVALTHNSNAQAIVKHAPPGFDSIHANIPHGKIDTITYDSKTVGNRLLLMPVADNISSDHLRSPTLSRSVPEASATSVALSPVSLKRT